MQIPNRKTPLHQRIRWARENAVSGRISQERFADLIGTSRRHLMRIESGQTQRPRKALLVRVAEVTGHDVALFLDEDDEESDSPMSIVVPVRIELTEDQLDRALLRLLPTLRQRDGQDAHLRGKRVLTATNGGYRNDGDTDD